jgi:hypothetical protein
MGVSYIEGIINSGPEIDEVEAATDPDPWSFLASEVGCEILGDTSSFSG